MGKIFPTGMTWKFGDERVIGFDPLIEKAYSISISTTCNTTWQHFSFGHARLGNIGSQVLVYPKPKTKKRP